LSRGEGDRIVDREPAGKPVAAGDAGAHRLLLRPCRAHRTGDLERQAQAVLEAAAVVVGALVRQRRDELVEEIAVRRVELDEIEAEPVGAPCGRDEIGGHLGDVLARHRPRRVPARVERHRRRGHGLPRPLVGLEGRAALPSHMHRGLASGVGQLDPDLGVAVSAAGLEDTRQGRLVGVRVEAEAAVRDAALRAHPRRLDHQEPGAGERELAQMHHVPIAGAAVDGAVLAHRRHGDAVGEREIAQRDRREELAWHGNPAETARNRVFRKSIVADANRQYAGSATLASETGW
jgi:hypothetical protein